MLYFGVGIAAAIVVFLVVLLVGPSLIGSTPVTGAPILTYYGAHPVADSVVGGFGGGGWTLLFAAGLVSPTAEQVPTNTSLLGTLSSYCTVTELTPLSSLTVPAYAGNRSSGASPAWTFAYKNSTDAVALVSVIDGHGTVVATLTGLGCALGVALGFSAVPGNAIDSSQVAKDVEPAAQDFLSAHPNASAVYALIGGVHAYSLNLPREWEVTYSSCTLNATPTGTGSEFNATVNVTTGKVLRTATSNSVACGSSTVSPTEPLNTSFDLGTQTVTGTSPDQNFSWPVIFAQNGITWDNLSAEVENLTSSGSTPVSAGWTLRALNSDLQTIATYDLASGTWTGAGTQPIAVGDRLVVSTTSDLSGDVLFLHGAGSFAGTQPWLL